MSGQDALWSSYPCRIARGCAWRWGHKRSGRLERDILVVQLLYSCSCRIISGEGGRGGGGVGAGGGGGGGVGVGGGWGGVVIRMARGAAAHYAHGVLGNWRRARYAMN